MAGTRKTDGPVAEGIKIRIVALENLIREQEDYLALLRMRRIRLDRDLVLAKRANR